MAVVEQLKFSIKNIQLKVNPMGVRLLRFDILPDSHDRRVHGDVGGDGEVALEEGGEEDQDEGGEIERGERGEQGGAFQEDEAFCDVVEPGRSGRRFN